MFMLRSLLVCGLVLALTTGADAAKGKKKKGQAGGLSGVVKEVTANTDKDTGSIMVQAMSKQKKGQPSAAVGEAKKVTIGADTKIERVAGKAKKGQPAVAGTPAKLSDISANSNVRVTLKSGSDVAEKVEIVAAKKGKKKKNT